MALMAVVALWREAVLVGGDVMNTVSPMAGEGREEGGHSELSVT